MEEIEVFPVAKSQVDWHQLIEILLIGLGRSPVQALDELREPVRDYRSFIVAVNGLVNRTDRRSIPTIIANAIEPLNHLFFSFIVIGELDSILRLLERTDVKFIISRTPSPIKTMIVSGTLQAWKTAITAYLCDLDAGAQPRAFYDKLMLYFQYIGLAELFNNFIPQHRTDGTFDLKEQ